MSKERATFLYEPYFSEIRKHCLTIIRPSCLTRGEQINVGPNKVFSLPMIKLFSSMG